MNKRLLVALMPFLIQTSLYCNAIDINQLIMPQLQSAQAIMQSNSPTPLTLQSTLKDLLTFGSSGKLQASQALDHMQSIKATLEYHKQEEEYAWEHGGRTWYDWISGNKSQKVEEAIKPAISQVDTALANLDAQSKKLGYKTESFMTKISNTFQAWKAYATELVNWLMFTIGLLKMQNQILGTANNLASITSQANTAYTKVNNATSIEDIQDACKDLVSLSNQVLSIGKANNIDLPIKPDQLLLSLLQ